MKDNETTQLEFLLSREPFSVAEDEKNKIMIEGMKELIQYHFKNCSEYQNILGSYDFDFSCIQSISDIPFVHVRLFKEFSLKSITDDNSVKLLSSSGTTSQKKSRIFLDKSTAAMQTKVLAKIVNSVIGSSRMPMLIIDTPSVLNDRKNFSARGAGIQGFSLFGKKKVFAFDNTMNICFDDLEKFLEEEKGKPILLFGFTFIIWEYFLQVLEKKGKKLDITNGILFHGGGWKKLSDKNISNHHFSEKLKEICGIKKVHNYYGMAEQTGSIFLECEEGFLHSSVFSDVIIRDEKDLTVCNVGKKGVIQVLSLLPRSYPGHSILTEDVGELVGLSGCKCGRRGKYFKVFGRLENVELRGCSDTYE